jgi:dimethylsulfoniopropionate demethylase
MTPRDIARRGWAIVSTSRSSTQGRLINDPVMLKLAEDRFWLSIADSDVLLYAMGLALGRGMDVEITNPTCRLWRCRAQRPKTCWPTCSARISATSGSSSSAGSTFQGTRQLIARSGYSRQGGFEIYLEGGHLGPALWDAIWEAGQPYNITPGCPNLIERIEGGLLSYGNEFTRENNPFEIGHGQVLRTDGSIDYIGRAALQDRGQRVAP